MGDLLGNYFRVQLRQIPSSFGHSVINDTLQLLKRYGFINYFGHQRFSGEGGNAPSHHVGRALVQRDWQEAVMQVLSNMSCCLCYCYILCQSDFITITIV